MKLIDNTSQLFGDDLKGVVERGSRLKIAASCFSIYAFEALKAELSKIGSLQFLFTAPTFVPNEVTGRLSKERREFFIPKARRESGLYGTEFEIHLRNKLTQRAVARECADWIRKKAKFRSNATRAPMQQFMHVSGTNGATAYMPISGFTAVDLGYRKGDAVSNFVTRFDEPGHAQSVPSAIRSDLVGSREGEGRHGCHMRPHRIGLPGKFSRPHLLHDALQLIPRFPGRC